MSDDAPAPRPAGPARTAGPARPTGLRRAVYHLNPFWVMRTYAAELALAGLVVSFLLVLLWTEVVVPVGTGQRGVYWSRFFGGTLDWRIREGTFLKLPWDTITLYNVRHQSMERQTVLLTKDGMTIHLHWYLRYYPIKDRLPELHRTYGPDYANTLIAPEVVASLREIIGGFRADEIYAQDEAGLLDSIAKETRQHLEDHPVVVAAIKIMRLDLPGDMAEAIVRKLIEEQRHLSYVFRLRSETAEAERREIEAKGLEKFRRFSGIDPLKWRGVKATVELAQSPNTKIVLMGTDAKQLPIILNAEPPAAPGALPGSVGASPGTTPSAEGRDGSPPPPPGG